MTSTLSGATSRCRPDTGEWYSVTASPTGVAGADSRARVSSSRRVTSLDLPDGAADGHYVAPEHPGQGLALHVLRLANDLRRVPGRNLPLLDCPEHLGVYPAVRCVYPGHVADLPPAHPQQLGGFPPGIGAVGMLTILLFLPGTASLGQGRDPVGNYGLLALVHVPAQAVLGQHVCQWVGAGGQVHEMWFHAGLFAGPEAVVTIHHFKVQQHHRLKQSLAAHIVDEPLESRRRHVREYPRVGADGMLILPWIIHESPPPGRNHY